MTEIINNPQNPPQNPSGDSSAAIVLGILFGALFVIFLLVFGVHYYSSGRMHSPYTSVSQPASPAVINVVVASGTVQ